MKPVHFSLAILGVAAFTVPFAFLGCDSTSPGESTTVPDAGPTATTGLGDASSPPPTVDGGVAAVTCPPPTKGPTQHGGSVSEDQTWTADGSPHMLPYDTSVYATLTLEPCAEVLIAGGATVTINAKGKLIARGTSTQPIHIGKKDAAPFATIRTTSGSPIELAFVTIDGGGDKLNTLIDYAGMISLQGEDQTKPTAPTLSVKHVTLKGSASNGIVLQGGAGFAPDSTNLTVTGSANYPVSMWSRAVGTVPDGTYTGNTHDEVLLWATGLSEGVHEDATVFDRGVPYHVGHTGSSGTLYVGTGSPGVSTATLTVMPNVKMRFKKGGVMYIESSSGDKAASGAMIAQGTSEKPIVFTSAEPAATAAAGDWLGIWYGEVPLPSNKLDWGHVEFAGGQSVSGGAACNIPPTGKVNDGAIRIFGPPASEFITNTTITDSAAHGVDRGYIGPLVDFLATNTFKRIGRCAQSYPRANAGGCPSPLPSPTDPAFCPPTL